MGGLISLAAALIALAWQLRRSGARLRLRVLPMPRFYVASTGRDGRPLSEASAAGPRPAGGPTDRVWMSTESGGGPARAGLSVDAWESDAR